jgi:hypothetical protein
VNVVGWTLTLPPAHSSQEGPQGQHQDHDLCCSTVGLFGVAGRGEQLVVRIATRAAARVLGPPSPFVNAPPAYAPRLPSQQPRAWSRRSQKDVKMGHYEPATTERGRGVRQRVVRREPMPRVDWILGNCGLFGIFGSALPLSSLRQPNNANGQYLQPSQNCHQPPVTSVIRHYHRLSLVSLSKRAS